MVRPVSPTDPTDSNSTRVPLGNDSGRSRIFPEPESHLVKCGFDGGTSDKTRTGVLVRSAHNLFECGFYQEESIVYTRGDRHLERYLEGFLKRDSLMYFCMRTPAGKEVKLIFLLIGRFGLTFRDLRERTVIQVRGDDKEDGTMSWSVLWPSRSQGSYNIRLICNEGVFAGKIIKQWNDGFVTQLNDDLMQEWGQHIRQMELRM